MLCKVKQAGYLRTVGRNCWVTEGKESVAEAEKEEKSRNKLQTETAVALRQSQVDFGS